MRPPRKPPSFLPLLLLLLATVMTHAACSRDTPARKDAPPVSTPDQTTPVPAAPAWLLQVEALYDSELRVPGLEARTFQPEQWWEVATPLLSPARGFSTETVGNSAEGRPLRHIAWGQGPITVLLWSQMHGDESTASMTLVDLFRFLGEHPEHPLVQQLKTRTNLHVLPVMNPDGAARFQRRNAQGIDINRDARLLASPEARTLKALRDRLQPAFGFNLHDQRVGYRVGTSDIGTAIALLAPPSDESRGINDVRKRAIEVAAVIRIALEPRIPGRIARWDDTFNPRAFGDLMTQWGTSTILIESGGIEGDPEKQALRRLNFIALVAGLESIASGSHAGTSPLPYSELPENGRTWPDLLIQGGVLAVPGLDQGRTDLLVNFRHPLAERGGTIADIGDLAGTEARRVIDATGLFIVPIQPTAKGSHAAKIGNGARAYFHLSRDPAGKDIVWTLAGDVDPQHPSPAPASTP